MPDIPKAQTPEEKRLAEYHAFRRLLRHEAAPVVDHLFARFPPSQPRFTGPPPLDPYLAALKDGQSQVTRHLEAILNATDEDLRALAYGHQQPKKA